MTNKNFVHILLLFLCYLTLLSGCDNDKNEGGLMVDLMRRDKISISDIFEKITVVPLELTEESMIKEITKVMVYNERYYVFDGREYKLLVFDSNGRYIQTIGEIGDGPGEASMFTNFSIDKFNNEILLLSAPQRKVFVFSESGILKNEIVFNSTLAGFQSLQCVNADVIAFFSADKDNRIKYYSRRAGIIIHEDFKEDKNDMFCSDMFRVDQHLCRGFSNTVFNLSSVSTGPGYTWDFGEKDNPKTIPLPSDKSMKGALRFASQVYSSEIVNYVFYVHGMNKHCYYAQLAIKNKLVNIFYSKANLNYVIFEKSSEGASIHPIFFADEYMIGTLGEFTQEDVLPFSIQCEEIHSQLSKITEDSNPFLIRYNFKTE